MLPAPSEKKPWATPDVTPKWKKQQINHPYQGHASMWSPFPKSTIKAGAMTPYSLAPHSTPYCLWGEKHRPLCSSVSSLRKLCFQNKSEWSGDPQTSLIFQGVAELWPMPHGRHENLENAVSIILGRGEFPAFCPTFLYGSHLAGDTRILFRANFLVLFSPFIFIFC